MLLSTWELSTLLKKPSGALDALQTPTVHRNSRFDGKIIMVLSKVKLLGVCVFVCVCEFNYSVL